MAPRRAHISPLRMEIVDEIRARGPSSIAELAAALVRPKTSLYFHVHKLVKAGVVRVKKKRKAARQIEAIYGLVPQHARREARLSARRAEQEARTAAALLRQAERNFGRAVRAGHSAVTLATSKRLRLDPSAARALTSEIDKLLLRYVPRRAGEPYLWTVTLAPAASEPRAHVRSNRS